MSMEYDTVVRSCLDRIERGYNVFEFRENAAALAQAVVEYDIGQCRCCLPFMSVGFTVLRSRATNGAHEEPYKPDDYRTLIADIRFACSEDKHVEAEIYRGCSFNEMLAAYYAFKSMFSEMAPKDVRSDIKDAIFEWVDRTREAERRAQERKTVEEAAEGKRQ